MRRELRAVAVDSRGRLEGAGRGIVDDVGLGVFSVVRGGAGLHVVVVGAVVEVDHGLAGWANERSGSSVGADAGVDALGGKRASDAGDPKNPRYRGPGRPRCARRCSCWRRENGDRMAQDFGVGGWLGHGR